MKTGTLILSENVFQLTYVQYIIIYVLICRLLNETLQIRNLNTSVEILNYTQKFFVIIQIIMIS